MQATIEHDAAGEARRRVEERSAEALRRRAGRTAARLAAARGRAHGMVERHAARLARSRPSGPESPFEPDLDCTE